MELITQSVLSQSKERTISSAAITAQPAEQSSYTRYSATARRTESMSAHDWRIHSEESRKKSYSQDATLQLIDTTL